MRQILLTDYFCKGLGLSFCISSALGSGLKILCARLSNSWSSGEALLSATAAEAAGAAFEAAFPATVGEAV
jgi:hypothetical protein